MHTRRYLAPRLAATASLAASERGTGDDSSKVDESETQGIAPPALCFSVSKKQRTPLAR